MDDNHYMVLQYLSMQTEGVELKDFPQQIWSEFKVKSHEVGGFRYELETVLWVQKGWVEKRQGFAGFWISSIGLVVLQSEDLNRMHADHIHDLQFKILQNTATPKKKWPEKHPIPYAIFLLFISGAVSLLVSLFQSSQEKQQYQQLERKVQVLSDSVTTLRQHIMDSARH